MQHTDADSPPSVPPHPGFHPGTGSGAQVLLVRHAEVHEDWRGKAYGSLDVPLSAAGEERTRALGDHLGTLAPDALLGSPLERARLLAERVRAASALDVTYDDGLREIDRGRWQGLTVADLHERHADDVEAFYADPWRWRGHGGEADEDVHARAWRPLDAALSSGRRRIVVATHYNVLRVVTASALGTPPDRSFALRVDTGRAVLLVDGPQGWELERSNALWPDFS